MHHRLEAGVRGGAGRFVASLAVDTALSGWIRHQASGWYFLTALRTGAVTSCRNTTSRGEHIDERLQLVAVKSKCRFACKVCHPIVAGRMVLV